MKADLEGRSKKYEADAEAFYQLAHAKYLKAKREAEEWESILKLGAEIGEKITRIPFRGIVEAFERWLNKQPKGELNPNSPEHAEYLRLSRVGRELEAEAAEQRRKISAEAHSEPLVFSAGPKSRKQDNPDAERKQEVELSVLNTPLSPNRMRIGG